MKKLLKALIGSAFVLASSAYAEAEYQVGVTSIVQHPSLDAIRDGIIDKLTETYNDNVEITFEAAQGDPTIAAQIAQKFATQDLDAVVAITTPSALAAKSAIDDKPVIFATVTDPVGAGLLDTMEASKDNITGTSDMIPIGQHMDMIIELFGNDITVGLPYNSSEANSVSMIDIARNEAEKRGLKMETAVAFTSSEVPQAVAKLLNTSDVIYMVNDNTIFSSADAIIAATIDADKPLFSAATEISEKGALVAAGFNYYDVGRQTADLVVEILNGKSVSEVPPQFAKGSAIDINLKTAAEIGYSFSDEFKQKATKIIE
ncbi:MAG: ABC transporter substrate-binding protein [Alphaproteobacteria bacterium]